MDPVGESHAGLGVGVTPGRRSEKHPSGLGLSAKKPSKGMSCASAEVTLTNASLKLLDAHLHHQITNAFRLLDQCQSL